MNVRFKSLTIKNFMSLVNETIDLEDLGVVLVKGINNYDPLFKSNGSGKSAIFDSILWVLTGYTSRGSSNVSNRHIDPTGAYVEILLYIDQDEYVITRTDGYKDFGKSIIIHKNGEDISGSTLTKSKEVLKSQLSFITYDVLTSIIILSQGLPGRLSNLKPSDRKSRLEYLSNTDGILEEIQSKLQNAHSELSTEIANENMEQSKVTASINTNQSTIDSCDSKIDEINKYNENNSNITQEVIDGYKSKIEEYKSSIQVLREKYSTFVKMESDLISQKNIHNSNLNELERKVKEYENQVRSLSDNICPLCKSKLSDASELRIHAELEIADLNLKCSEEARILKELNSKVIPSSDLYNQKMIELDSEIVSMTRVIDEFTRMSSSIESYNTTKEECQSKIDELEIGLVEINKKLSELNKSMEIYNFFKSAVSRKFRNFLLDGVLQYLNQRLEYYSKYLFSNGQIVKLESNGNNIDIRLGDAYFEDLSGGEGRRVDIILQLAQRDLSRTESGFSCNLLVLDEILDYLDSDGIYSVLNMLEKESSNVDSLLIVTHKDELSVPNDSTITVVKGSDQLSHINKR